MMTDARLRGEWLTAPAHDGLTDAAYRVLHNALMHSAEQGTDGAIASRELRFLYPGVVEQATLDELERAGFWERNESGYQLIGWTTTLGQSSAKEVDDYRRNARERQQKHREMLKRGADPGLASEPARSEVVTRDIPRDVGEARQGTSLGRTAAYVTRDTEHPHEPNARRALSTLRAERRLPLDDDELLQSAYRLGDGDPWNGYLRIKHETETAIVNATSPAAVLRKRLGAA